VFLFSCIYGFKKKNLSDLFSTQVFGFADEGFDEEINASGLVFIL